jgi:DNA-directed RNA polymerase specialized sigma24 family protein
VLRCFYCGWTTGQAAADLEITDGTVKSRLHDALRMLLACGATDRCSAPTKNVRAC